MLLLSDLPAELVEEILSRVPATSLKRLRSTCKQWNSLLKAPCFSEKHFRNAPKQFRVVMLKEYRLFPVSVDLNVVPPSIEFKDALSLQSDDSKQEVRIAEVFHCDGLLLCITQDHEPVVWNPYLGETRWIQHKNGYDLYCMFALGYGNNNNQSCRSYKILMHRERSSRRVENPGDGGFEIYEFGGSDSWRVVVSALKCVSNIRSNIWYTGVTLKGNTYSFSEYDHRDRFLLSFDFTRERFKRLCLPPPSPGRGYNALSVVREEKLSVMSFDDSSVMSVWVTKKIDDTELSWSKSFVVRRHVYGSLLIDEEKKVFLCYSRGYERKNVVYTIGELEEDNKYYSEILYTRSYRHAVSFEFRRPNRPVIFNYIPSLVQIQPKTVVSSSQAVPINSETATFSGDIPDCCLNECQICSSGSKYLFEDSSSETRRGGT